MGVYGRIIERNMFFYSFLFFLIFLNFSILFNFRLTIFFAHKYRSGEGGVMYRVRSRKLARQINYFLRYKNILVCIFVLGYVFYACGEGHWSYIL